MQKNMIIAMTKIVHNNYVYLLPNSSIVRIIRDGLSFSYFLFSFLFYFIFFIFLELKVRVSDGMRHIEGCRTFWKDDVI